MTKTSEQKFNYLKNKERLKMKLKALFNINKELSVARNCLRPKSVPSNVVFYDLVLSCWILK